MNDTLLKTRQDFPLFQKMSPPIYFDNACATLKPESVLLAMDTYNREYPTCGGRSVHHLAERVTNAVYDARTAVAKFLNTNSPEEIVFVKNTTEGINLLSYSLPLKSGQVVLTSDKEHNSNLIPWQRACARTGAIHKVVRSNPDGTFDINSYTNALNEGGVSVVAMGITSNIDGVSIPAKEVVTIAHQHGAMVVLDAAQAAPQHNIDVNELDVDFLVFSGHKLCGPSGTGIVYGKADHLKSLPPFITGGSTVSTSTYHTHELLPSPDKFEGGTQDYAGIIGLGAAVRYIDAIGKECIKNHEHSLNQYATEQLLAIPGAKILGPHDPMLRSGIVSFTIDDIDVHQIALTLDKSANVAVRSGQHCVHSWFTDRNILGSVRFSFYIYNTKDEIDVAFDALKNIVAVYR